MFSVETAGKKEAHSESCEGEAVVLQIQIYITLFQFDGVDFEKILWQITETLKLL